MNNTDPCISCIIAIDAIPAVDKCMSADQPTLGSSSDYSSEQKLIDLMQKHFSSSGAKPGQFNDKQQLDQKITQHAAGKPVSKDQQNVIAAIIDFAKTRDIQG